MNELPRPLGLAVIADWRAAAAQLPALTEDAAHHTLNLDASYRTWVGPEIAAHRDDIAQLLRELADECEAFYEQNEWVSVLGM